jgi:hypothetical protein
LTLTPFLQQKPSLLRLKKRIIPPVTINVAVRRNYRRFAAELHQRSPAARVLVIGAGEKGAGSA